MWRTKYFSFIVFLSIAVIFVFSASCRSNKDESEESDTTKQFVAKAFSVANYNFAILQDNKFITYNKAIYHRGDEVYLVLENVGPFKLGSDSMNHAEMKLRVTDAIGQQIVLRDSILGEKGHKRFMNNTLASPYGSFSSRSDQNPGKYTFCITIYDLIRKDSAVVSDDFFIE
jgi:hypothetical protein